MPELSLPTRSARSASRSTACTPRARWAPRPRSRRARSSSPGATSACSSSATRSSPRATPRGRSSGGRSGGQGAGGTFAPWIRNYIQRSKAPEHIGWKVAVKDRLNALKNPYAHLHLTDISIEKVQGVPDAVGPAALPRVVPVVGRRGGDRARQRGRSQEGAAPPGVGHRPRQAHRVRPVPRAATP